MNSYASSRVSVKEVRNAFGTHSGKNTYSVLDENIDRLEEVPGLTEKKCVQIKQSYADMKSVMEITKFLIEYNIPPRYAKKLPTGMEQRRLQK